ncbi:MAG: hypothetical protein JNIBNLAF_01300 [Nitrosomonas europaea]|nr:hypothetical protein [Nitrosomonas europaea]
MPHLPDWFMPLTGADMPDTYLPLSGFWYVADNQLRLPRRRDHSSITLPNPISRLLTGSGIALAPGSPDAPAPSPASS